MCFRENEPSTVAGDDLKHPAYRRDFNVVNQKQPASLDERIEIKVLEVWEGISMGAVDQGDLNLGLEVVFGQRELRKPPIVNGLFYGLVMYAPSISPIIVGARAETRRVRTSPDIARNPQLGLRSFYFCENSF